MNFRLLGAIIGLVLVAGCSSSSDDAGESGLRVEQLFTGGLIYDGSGSVPVLADLGISDGKIAFIGDAEDSGVEADETIDVAGHWVTPGFIDAHSHAQLDLDYGRDAVPFLYQGITSVVLGVDGMGKDIAERMAIWNTNGIGVNGLLFIGHGAIRDQVMGRDEREPNAGGRIRTFDGSLLCSRHLCFNRGSYRACENGSSLWRCDLRHT
jgi:N-acyl-D-aspartate/D-glutamate deacylase